MEVIFLISSVSGDLATKGRMDTVERLFASKGIRATVVDAASNREKREELFRVSGIRGVFPQIFIHNPVDHAHRFISVDEVSSRFAAMLSG